MVFSSVIFLFFFLPIFLAAYYMFPRARNDILLGASLLFYAWGELAFFPVLLGIIAINYLVAARFEGTRRRHAWLVTGIAANLAVLGCFKYLGFLDTNLQALFGLHIPGAARFSRIPLGISFFTFQAMSYLIDVYRGDAPPERRFKTVALYIAMFPQLVAGPIVRFSQVCRELHSRHHHPDNVAKGFRIFILGLASKALIANTVAVPADAIFGLTAGQMGPGLAWLGLLCYTLQIYFDFAGYSWMAIGLGLMLGFRFPKNFDLPYSSLSITDFWRRWHISLSTFFRDYLYIPLGGNRASATRTYLNLVIVFLLCGLWHGAKWTFVLWGVYHGLFLVAERIGKVRSSARFWPLQRLYAIGIVMGGWVLFRSESLNHALLYFQSLAGRFASLPAERTALEFLSPTVILALTIGLLVSGFLRRPKEDGRQRHGEQPEKAGKSEFPFPWLQPIALALLLLLSMCAIASGTYNPFIYFNF